MSTLDYYKGIIDGYRLRTADGNYPQMAIDSLILAEIYSHVANKQWNEFIDRLVGSIKNLAAGGAEFAFMTANTAHIVFDEVGENHPCR